MARPLLEVKNLSKTFGKQVVLQNVSFQIASGQKIALIGRNGAGKTTLLKLLTGALSSDGGEVTTFDWTRVGMVAQNEVLPADITGLAYLEQETGKPAWDIKKLGARFGLHADHLEVAPAELSGGYQMRVKLTKLFLMEPNLLYLDEPVNYLDLQTLLLLEDVLADYRGSFLLVAHDRTFLENTCEVTFEVERGTLTTYNGPVSQYLAYKAEQEAFKRRTNKKLAAEIKHHQTFVDRFRYKESQASRAQNKIKHIAKLRSKIQHIEADLSTTRMVIKAPASHPGLALRVQDLAIGYNGVVIADAISFDVDRGEKVVIAGENGRGKSTLLKTLVGKLEPISGNYKWWKHASIGYYDQLTSKSLKDAETVLSHLTESAPAGTTGEKILMMAGNFLFQGDDLDKRVAVLSGGERARLALAGILLAEHNMLILDEPTNHMDVETTEALAGALKRYTGTVLFVSHARTFVGTLADKILEVRNGTVREYMGSYDDYVEDVAALMEADVQTEEVQEDMGKERSRQERRERNARVRELQRAIKKLETELEELESKKSVLMKFFFENPTDYAPKKALELEEIKREILKREESWVKRTAEVEELRSGAGV